MFRPLKTEKPIETRLRILSRDLVAKLKECPVEKQRAAGVAACEFAISHAEIDDPSVREALAKFRAGTLPSAVEKTQLEALRAGFDEEYFKQKEAADSGEAARDEWKRVFAKARAVAALIFACEGDPFRACTEAIYEASFTMSDQKELLAVIESVVG
jgi:hypothetical protein